MRYRLPARELIGQPLKEIHPWLQGLLGSDDADVARALSERWSGLKSPILRALAESMLPVTDAHFIIYDPSEKEWGQSPIWFADQRYWVSWVTPQGSAVDPQTRDPKTQQYILGAPPTADLGPAIAKHINPAPFLIDFFTSFHLLRECVPCHAGDFTSPLHWSRVSDDDYLPRFKGAKRWTTAVDLYHAANGDYVLLSSEGSTAWAQMETQQIIPLTSTFEAFVKHYIAYRKFSWPFDSWGAERFGI